jgi:hypothetical protein
MIRMAHPSPEPAFRYFEVAFLWLTIAASAALTCILAGVPRLVFER